MNTHLTIASIAQKVSGRKPRKARDGNAEARVQAAICSWVRTVAPQTIIAAIPNGGLRSNWEAARMKGTGTLAGMPDLIVLAPAGKAYFIECKSVSGRTSPEQDVLFFTLSGLGFQTAICRSIDDARIAFKAWGIQTKETVAHLGVT